MVQENKTLIERYRDESDTLTLHLSKTKEEIMAIEQKKALHDNEVKNMIGKAMLHKVEIEAAKRNINLAEC